MVFWLDPALFAIAVLGGCIDRDEWYFDQNASTEFSVIQPKVDEPRIDWKKCVDETRAYLEEANRALETFTAKLSKARGRDVSFGEVMAQITLVIAKAEEDGDDRVFRNAMNGRAGFIAADRWPDPSKAVEMYKTHFKSQGIDVNVQ